MPLFLASGAELVKNPKVDVRAPPAAVRGWLTEAECRHPLALCLPNFAGGSLGLRQTFSQSCVVFGKVSGPGSSKTTASIFED